MITAGTKRTSRTMLTAACAIGLAAIVIGHPDDPKARDRRPRYEGPGWRAVDAREGRLRGATPFFPASGMTLQSWIPLGDFGGGATSANDCWGYTSPSGREYAILGLADGTAFVEVTNPGAAGIIAKRNGPISTWRDIKTYDHYAYAVSEGGGGIQVFDLQAIDQGIVSPLSSVVTGGIDSSHNVAIDEQSGFLYRCGGGSNGLRIYDLANPAAPEYVGFWADRYVHDAQIRTMDVDGRGTRQIAFCSSGFNSGWVEPGVDILDVTDKDNIELLSRVEYPNAQYCHQSWLSEDGQFLYINDELDEDNLGIASRTIIADVSDLENPIVHAPFDLDQPAITHNTYVRGDLLFAANYTSGVRVMDISDRAAPREVGFFDTVPNAQATSFNGLWNVYPFFPSGTVIGSDIERGLFVWSVHVDQLAINIDDDDGDGEPLLLEPLGGAISFQVQQLEGTLDASTVKLFYDDGSGFEPASITSRSTDHFAAQFPELSCAQTLRWYIEAATTGGDVVRYPAMGSSAPALAYVTNTEPVVLVDDNFESPSSWTPSVDGATSGGWEQGAPVADPTWTYGPNNDADGGGQAWLTGNIAGNSDVDGGAVLLTSDPFSLAGRVVEFAYEYYLNLTNDFGSDALIVEISISAGGGPWVEVARHDLNGGRLWRSHTITPADLQAAGITPSPTTRIRFTAVDTDPQAVVEAGIDRFTIRQIMCSAPAPGDANGDGQVNVADLLAVINAWGGCDDQCPPACSGDVNADCQVNVADLLEVINNWGG